MVSFLRWYDPQRDADRSFRITRLYARALHDHCQALLGA